MKYQSDQPTDPTDMAESTEPPSKSARKREVARLQALGEQLLTLNAAQLAQIPLDDPLAKAIEEGQRIKSREGLRRHKQYIGKLMRHADVAAIDDALARFDHDSQLNTRAFHVLETWRERLLSEGQPALTACFDAFPNADRQHLRQLVKQAVQERKINTQQGSQLNKQSRALFRYLRTLSNASE